MHTRSILVALFATVALTAPAIGQLIPSVPRLPGQVIGDVLGTPTSQRGPIGRAPGGVVDSLGASRLTEGLDAPTLLALRRDRLRTLVRANRKTLDVDDEDNPIRRGEVIAIAPSPALMDAARDAGFTILREASDDDLGLRMIVFAPPRGRSADKAAKLLRTIDPRAEIELNHIFEPAGGALLAGGAAAATGANGGALIGMIDGGVAAHPALAGAGIEQRAFTPRGVRATGHGTAIASLLVGKAGAFSGALPGNALLAADVYGGDPAAGSAETIVRALGWLASRRPRVITVSLVGPPNRLLERALKIVQSRGITIVAAVGNDGPAAPPQYPASYPGIVAVTGVDARDRALAEAGKPLHLDFAAPGADMAAALPGKGYARVRGTSFAAPLVAARIALTGSIARLDREAAPGKGKVGRGIVCRPCRIAPAAVGAR